MGTVLEAARRFCGCFSPIIGHLLGFLVKERRCRSRKTEAGIFSSPILFQLHTILSTDHRGRRTTGLLPVHQYPRDHTVRHSHRLSRNPIRIGAFCLRNRCI